MREYPYAHLYVDDVFPEDFYHQLRTNWPSSSSLVSLADTGRVPKGSYPERFILPLLDPDMHTLDENRRIFWSEFGSWFLSERFLNAMIEKFSAQVRARFGDETFRKAYGAEALVVRDLTNYSIGPHTDAPDRLMSLLFYCPDDDSRTHLGTSIYVPKGAGLGCAGGPHYAHHNFRKVKTMEYRRNALFAFIKSDYSFHGVEPIGDQAVGRDVLLYDIRILGSKPAPAQTGGLGLALLKRLFGKRNS